MTIEHDTPEEFRLRLASFETLEGVCSEDGKIEISFLTERQKAHASKGCELELDEAMALARWIAAAVAMRLARLKDSDPDEDEEDTKP